ncbi:hypothetical protein Q3152_15930 [Clostridioides difficile]|uniref:hypothetical protein n=1 Tax=Clostridioides difficile TaxID=1496 RepID=UPI00038CDEFD|nr:hypothetical protein [Clostridioides difficile]EQJ20262.1 hypothetical protein QS3_0279 [Clostridioides difficile P13]ERM52174.1 hypothetical protein QUQ_0291 [Clostridioides difficile P68]MBH7250625.1 hypothetical protein [Clostridioides difficile]MBJ8544388.1 hypothetical protein [Clostridioides difficile]MBJ8569500.1 hypothetical protein [Clostridioides difficile]
MIDKDIEFISSLKRLSYLIQAKENLIEDIHEYSNNEEDIARYENLDKAFEKTIIDEAKFLISLE